METSDAWGANISFLVELHPPPRESQYVKQLRDQQPALTISDICNVHEVRRCLLMRTWQTLVPSLSCKFLMRQSLSSNQGDSCAVPALALVARRAFKTIAASSKLAARHRYREACCGRLVEEDGRPCTCLRLFYSVAGSLRLLLTRGSRVPDI